MSAMRVLMILVLMQLNPHVGDDANANIGEVDVNSAGSYTSSLNASNAL